MPATQPFTHLLEVSSTAAPNAKPLVAVAGAAVDPTHITPALPAPADFDAFWTAALAELADVPLNPQVQQVASEPDQPGYYKVTLGNIRGSHASGQLARPKLADPAAKFPAVLVVQWAGIYPLEKDWVVSRARGGWLALNILAHDVPSTSPRSSSKLFHK